VAFVIFLLSFIDQYIECRPIECNTSRLINCKDNFRIHIRSLGTNNEASVPNGTVNASSYSPAPSASQYHIEGAKDFSRVRQE
jgi:hypothetical protein